MASVEKLASIVPNERRDLDPFDPAALRLDVLSEDVGVKRLLTTIPVRKPRKQEFVRVNPAPEYRISPIAMIELEPEREVYLVPPAMAGELSGMFDQFALYTAITRQNVLFLWPVKLPGDDGRQMEWHRSLAEAAEKAMTDWVRVRANMALGAYEISLAIGRLSEPNWPDLTLPEILKIAFRDRMVDRDDHIVVKRLRGEI